MFQLCQIFWFSHSALSEGVGKNSGLFYIYELWCKISELSQDNIKVRGE